MGVVSGVFTEATDKDPCLMSVKWIQVDSRHLNLHSVCILRVLVLAPYFCDRMSIFRVSEDNI